MTIVSAFCMYVIVILNIIVFNVFGVKYRADKVLAIGLLVMLIFNALTQPYIIYRNVCIGLLVLGLIFDKD